MCSMFTCLAESRGGETRERPEVWRLLLHTVLGWRSRRRRHPSELQINTPPSSSHCMKAVSVSFTHTHTHSLSHCEVKSGLQPPSRDWLRLGDSHRPMRNNLFLSRSVWLMSGRIVAGQEACRAEPAEPESGWQRPLLDATPHLLSLSLIQMEACGVSSFNIVAFSFFFSPFLCKYKWSLYFISTLFYFEFKYKFFFSKSVSFPWLGFGGRFSVRWLKVESGSLMPCCIFKPTVSPELFGGELTQFGKRKTKQTCVFFHSASRAALCSVEVMKQKVVSTWRSFNFTLWLFYLTKSGMKSKQKKSLKWRICCTRSEEQRCDKTKKGDF